MKTINKYTRSLYRRYRFPLYLFLVIAVQLSFPGLLSAITNQPGSIPLAAAASDPVIAAAGDIACDPSTSAFNNGLGTSDSCRQKYTSDLLVSMGPAAVLDLGDNQYYCGGYQAFIQSYDLSWGRVKSITHPSVGNHEYLTSGGTGCSTANAGAAGYFQYFGAATGAAGQGYYSFDIGTWHIIALNSNCGNVGGCGSTSAQYKWLQADLAAHTNLCTLAYWHIPLFSSGGRASKNSLPFWNLLYANNADLILNGHDHIYERFAPQTPTGTLDLVNGITEFIVGTGGADHTSINSVAANSVVSNASTYGVLKLTLHPASFDWQFVPEAGKTFTDSGTTACHGSIPNTPTPTVTLATTNTPTSTATATATAIDTPTPTDTSATVNSPSSTSTVTDTQTSTDTPTPTATIGTSTVTFLPVADTYVNAGSTGNNYGSATTLRLNASPDVHAYLRFTISGISGTVLQARLLLYANTSNSVGIRAWAVSNNTWGELTTTYANAPSLGSLLASTASFTSGVWVSLDVTSYVTGNGIYSFGVTSLSTTSSSMASRESGVNAPQLIVTYNGALSPTSTPTSAATPTSTNIPTSTAVFTPTSTSPFTPTATANIVFTPTPTATPIFTPTATATPTATTSATSTSGPVNTPTPTLTPLPPPTPTFTPVVSSVTFIPVADTYINGGSTGSNYGSATTLRLNASPDVHAYLRFTISGISGTVLQARLLLYANTSNSVGIRAWAVSNNTWGELTTTYANAPSLGSLLASTASFTSGVWVSLDVTSYVTGNGTYSFGVTSLSTTSSSMASRESGANAPQIVITYH